MSDTVDIAYTETETKGRYAARVEGIEEEGELTISKVTDALIIADHTLVPDALRGKGIAGALVKRLIEDARAKGQRIVPLCPFVRGYAERKKDELADVIQW